MIDRGLHAFARALTYEAYYQRHRTEAPSPWEDTRENRSDWMRDFIVGLSEALDAIRKESGER